MQISECLPTWDESQLLNDFRKGSWWLLCIVKFKVSAQEKARYFFDQFHENNLDENEAPPCSLGSSNRKARTAGNEKNDWRVWIIMKPGPRQPLHLLFLDNSLIALSFHMLLWKHMRKIWGPPESLASLHPILYKKNKIIKSNNSLNKIWISPLHSGIYLSLFSWANIDHLNDFPEM